MKEELLRKLTSRKLWLALAGMFTGAALAFGVESSEIASVAGAVTALLSVAAYVVTEGAVDIERIHGFGEAVGQEKDDDNGDTAA